jgi:single-stranded DNA-binding protein
VCKFGLAINNRVKKGDDWADEPCFIDVVLFCKSALAEAAILGSPCSRVQV